MSANHFEKEVRINEYTLNKLFDLNYLIYLVVISLVGFSICNNLYIHRCISNENAFSTKFKDTEVIDPAVFEGSHSVLWVLCKAAQTLH